MKPGINEWGVVVAKGLNGGTTKEAIRQAAIVEFRAHGFRDASLEDIAKTLGITRAAVLYHFGCKVELLTAVLDPYLNAVEALLLEYDAGIELNAKQRRRLLAELTDLFVAHHEVAGILIRDISSYSNAVVTERVAVLTETLTILMTRVRPTKVDRVIVASILGAVLRPLTDPLIDPTDPETRSIISRLALLLAKQIDHGRGDSANSEASCSLGKSQVAMK